MAKATKLTPKDERVHILRPLNRNGHPTSGFEQPL
jgi:hypothetical protein